MSLAVDGDARGGRSRSRSRDRRSRADDAPTYADVREPSYAYPEDDLDDRYRSSRHGDGGSGGGLPYPSEGGFDNMLPSSKSLYGYDDRDRRRSSNRAVSPAPGHSSYRSSRDKVDAGQLPGAFPGDDDYDGRDHKPRVRTADPRDSKYSLGGGGSKRDSYRDRRGDEDDGGGRRRVRYAEPPVDKYDLDDDKLKFLPQKYSRKYADDDDDDDDPKLSRGSDRERDKERKKDRRRSSRRDDGDDDDLAYGRAPPPRSPRPESPPSTYGSYLSGSQWEDKRSSKYSLQDDEPDRRRPVSPSVDDQGRRSSHRDSYRDDPRGSGANVLTVDPSSRDRRRDRSPGPAALTAEPDRRERDRSRDRRGSTRDRSPQPPTARMSTLTVDTGRSSNTSLSAAPASPLLESYHGTYQDCSPMPSPLLIASAHPSEDARALEALSPISSDAEGEGGKRRSRRARFHDPEDIATRLARALKGDRAPDTEPLIEVLPGLTHEQVMELRAEYKQLVKTGADRKGVNVAKHIRARLKDEDPSLMKACYATALGKWESEAYWANFWYQGDKTRRELLIESLMGRSNEEIRRIKDAFTDKKYDNSLSKCMRTELKEDKFKKAVLLVLDERRMDEYDHHGRRLPLDYDLVDKDVADLRRAVKGDKGGESLMISIVVQRSDPHLRSVLKEYERAHGANFARDALKKSGNLVGELLAHILNGVINRPVRDALLLNHALTASRRDELRRELLISRLVRFHWDALHMRAVRRAYRERYGADLQAAVRDASSGPWGLFCTELCIARTPDDVRRMERVEVIR